MFDFAWSEIMVIALIALVVIGPKDLPRVLRTLGKYASRARMIAREFQGSIDQMIRESELDEVRREVQKVAQVDLDHEIKSTVDPKGELEQGIREATTPPAEPPKTPLAAVAAGTGKPEPPPADGAASMVEAPAPAKEGEHDHNKTSTPV
jgi:sec-independent protein translocase protein TatB